MTNIQQSIEQQVSVFMRNISELVRRAAIEALEQAVVVPGKSTEGVGEHQPRKGTRSGKSKPPKRNPAPPREPAELAALTERLYAAIAAHPGETMEVLAPAVGCPGNELRVSIGHLVDRGRVKKAGERRSTRYFPMDAQRA